MSCAINLTKREETKFVYNSLVHSLESRGIIKLKCEAFSFRGKFLFEREISAIENNKSAKYSDNEGWAN